MCAGKLWLFLGVGSCLGDQAAGWSLTLPSLVLTQMCREVPIKGSFQVLAWSSSSGLSCIASGREVVLAEPLGKYHE